MTYSTQLRAVAAQTWDAAVCHRFVDEIWRGVVPRPVLTTYLVQDHQFFDAFVALLGSAIAAADRPEPRLRLARQLAVLAGPENSYFARALDALDVPLVDRTNPVLLPPTVGFLELMDTARRSGDYVDCLTVLLVAEWLYLDWASRPGAQAPDEPIQREWIDLHRGLAFESWVTFLRDEFDRVTAHHDDARRAHVADRFNRAVALELAFFNAAYSENSSDRS